MTNRFHTLIRQAIANSNLQAALDGNAERRRNARLIAFQSLPEDLQILRQRAHTVRANTIENLIEYRHQFIENVKKNGIVVHSAANADQANDIILKIAREKNVKLVAKSKSMVSEEIGLNHALETNGFMVIETDLGEYIVQLRGEPPAHIITPAVHLLRADVGKLFAEKLGIDQTEDIPTLTSVARKVLHQVFLDADLGISGVNFGIAESGTLCLLTNEGNGRMVTTLPRVHIAIMGIERIVPTFEDLNLLLQLLPRSATGQKLTVYVSLINNPRRQGEIDGCEERHLILVDNGRNSIRESSLAEVLFCIRCGACLNVCPVFREIGGHAYVGKNGKHSPYPGPIGSVLSPGLFGIKDFGQLARASSLCGACKEACPVDIDLPKLLLRVRAGRNDIVKPSVPRNIPRILSLGLHAFTWFATKARLFGVIQSLGGIASHTLAPKQAYLRLPAITGWGYSKDFPRLAIKTFQQRWAKGEIQNQIPNQKITQQEPPTTNSLSNNMIHQPQEVSLLDRFADELNAIGGKAVTCNSQNLANKIIEELKSRGIDRIATWNEEQLIPGLFNQLSQAGIQIDNTNESTAKAGITGAIAGIANTGSIVVTSGIGKPLTTSLLPEIHLAIIDKRNIYQDLEQALLKEDIKKSSVVIIISGPSRTADIEMTLSIGVHGPKEVVVFCLNDEE